MRGLTLAILLYWGCCAQAWSAPWVQAEDGMYVRASLADERISDLDGVRSDLYAEYGLSEKWTLTSKFEHVAYPDNEDFDQDGWRVSARRNILNYKGLTGSVEVGALQGGAIGGRLGCDKLGGEARAGLAWSGNWRKTQTFVFAETALRFHNDCQRERFEFGLGQQAIGPVWIVSQIWMEQGGQLAFSNKYQTDVLWKAETWEASIGYREETGGQFQERALIFGLARRF